MEKVTLKDYLSNDLLEKQEIEKSLKSIQNKFDEKNAQIEKKIVEFLMQNIPKDTDMERFLKGECGVSQHVDRYCFLSRIECLVHQAMLGENHIMVFLIVDYFDLKKVIEDINNMWELSVSHRIAWQQNTETDLSIYLVLSL